MFINYETTQTTVTNSDFAVDPWSTSSSEELLRSTRQEIKN